MFVRSKLRRDPADLSSDADRCAAETGEGATSPRLPMTLNVVLKAKGDHAIDGNGQPITCAEIARRWLAAGDLPLTGAGLAEKLPRGTARWI